MQIYLGINNYQAFINYGRIKLIEPFCTFSVVADFNIKMDLRDYPKTRADCLYIIGYQWQKKTFNSDSPFAVGQCNEFYGLVIHIPEFQEGAQD